MDYGSAQKGPIVEPSIIVGRWSITLDDRGRFQLPAVVRQRLDSKGEKGFYITKAAEKQLRIFWGSQFENAVAHVAQGIDPSMLDDFLLQFGSSSVLQELDAAGRLTIPEYLLKDSRIEPKSTVVLVGKLYYLEVWKADHLADALERIRNSPIASKMTELMNSTLPKAEWLRGGTTPRSPRLPDLADPEAPQLEDNNKE
ncbi:MAG: hypothetical protein Kow00107_01630 [Planctomycetota bacterium]